MKLKLTLHGLRRKWKQDHYKQIFRAFAHLNKCSYNRDMIAANEVARIVLEELDKLQQEQHWGELVFKVSLKNGDLQQLAARSGTTRRMW